MSGHGGCVPANPAYNAILSFDRLLLAQAKVEKYALMTHDSLIPLFQEKGIISV